MTMLDALPLGHLITPARELAHAPSALVRFGAAPDGLPWLLRADRTGRLQRLRTAVLQSFDLEEWESLPERIRTVLDQDVAAGLMGVHDAALPSTRAARRVYVSRRTARELFGPSILSQVLDQPSPTAAPRQRTEPITAMSAAHEDGQPMDDELAARVEERIRERSSDRRLLIDLGDDSAWVGSVQEADRALRRPSPHYRPAVFESLAALPGAVACVSSGRELWRVPAADPAAYAEALDRAGSARIAGAVTFEVPRAALLDALIRVARHLGRSHAQGMVHGDVTPGNLVLHQREPVSIDSLSLKAGEIAAAATFEWASPEQIVGRPLDGRADVFSLGRMVVELAGGVRFGEETVHVVPVGGTESRKVKLLKNTGVFLDVTHSGQSRDWQRAWQDLLSRCVAYDVERRPADGTTLADALAELARTHPLPGSVELAGDFGSLVPLVAGSAVSYARLAVDE